MRALAALNKNILHFLESSPSAISGRKSKAQKHIQMIFSKNALGDGPGFGFFQNSRIRVKCKISDDEISKWHKVSNVSQKYITEIGRDLTLA